jgi:hypothetical protein
MAPPEQSVPDEIELQNADRSNTYLLKALNDQPGRYEISFELGSGIGAEQICFRLSENMAPDISQIVTYLSTDVATCRLKLG